MHALNLPGWLVALLLILALPPSVRTGVELGRLGVHGVEEADVAASTMGAAVAASASGGRDRLPPYSVPLLPCEHEGSSCAVDYGSGESLEEHSAGYEAAQLVHGMPVDPFFDFGSYVLSRAYFPALLRPPIA